ncbi:hypothetical protein GGS26DRAFT_433422 [Hypomontagnella submonticulosa]|nr:hypothetical protein GGS26DRAFT_433422 [Hypomontagnella submonticulosa]
MELSNHSCREELVVDGRKNSTDVITSRLPRKSSLTNNFSYPRPDRELRRHESSESRSSLMSDGSVPGMTDSSDSEFSFEEDSSYNTSACELWDSFWPDSTVAPGEQYPVLLRASQTPNYFTKSFLKRKAQDGDDTITVPKLEPVSPKTKPSKAFAHQPSPPRPATRDGTPTYSIYPKPEPVKLLRVDLPPRTSSLNTVPLSPTRQQVLMPSKSSVNLKAIRPSHNLKQNYSVPKVPLPPTTSNSVPVSPTYPPPPPPTRALRSASSAINLREKSSALSQIRHNATAPLSLPIPPIPTSAPECELSSRPELEHYVSVFEFDSDHESYMESSSFTKRIARGFHKKSASEKRSGGVRRGSEDSEAQGKDGPNNRKRGGSLGRILGLRSR